MKSKLVYQGIAAGILYSVLELSADYITTKKLDMVSVAEAIVEGTFFAIFLIWLLKDRKVVNKISKKRSCIENFLIGFISSLLILTVLVIVKNGFIPYSFYKNNFLLISIIYLFTGFISGLSWSFINYIKHKR